MQIVRFASNASGEFELSFLRRVFACLLVLSAVAAAHAQISPYWQTKVDDPLAWNSSIGKVDPAGNYYLASVMTYDGGTGYFRLTKFSPSGEILWKKDQFKNYILNGVVWQVLLTSTGDILVGAEYGEDYSDITEIYHYNSNGDLLWTKNGGEMKLDSAGRLFVLETWDGHESMGAILRRIDVATGAEIQEEIGHDAEGYESWVSGWAPDDHGGAWVDGYISPMIGDSWDYFTHIPFDVAYTIPPAFDYPYSLEGFARRTDGAFYVSSIDPSDHQGHLGRLSDTLQPSWDVALGAYKYLIHLRVDPSENLIATLQTFEPGTSPTYELRKYSPTGTLLWSRPLGSSYDYLAIWDGSGNMFFRQGNLLYKFLPNMNAGWPNPVDLSTAGDGLSRDAAGNFYFGGAYSKWTGSDFVAYLLETKYGPTNNASFVTQNVPSAMVAGQSYSVSVTMTNTGASTWSLGSDFYLRSQSPTDNLTWGRRRVDLSPSEAILPGQTKKFSFTVYAPTTAGSYKFQWRMSQGSSSFGGSSPLLTVPVVVKQHAARYVSQTLPSSVKAGSTFNVTVTMRNVGTNTWTAAAGYGIAPATGYPTWNVTKVNLGPTDSIAPGQSKTFTIQCKAPTTPGSYTMRWQMRRDAAAFTGFFGDMSTTKGLTVTP